MKKAQRILLILTLSVFILLAGSTGTFLLLTSGVSIDRSKLVSSESNLILYDKYGTEIKELSATNRRTNTPIANLPSYTPQAFLSIEDKGFYSHAGINAKRMIKATLENLKSRSFSQGASTITQQLIKNTHLSSEKTLIRKLKEIRLAFQLEREYEKDEILECYLNTVYFGHSAFGISDASDFYFGKKPEELTLSESALLAGLLQSPNRYSPFLHPDRCKQRRDLVLSEMKRDGMISEEEWRKAKEEELPSEKHSKKQSAYLELVLEELEEMTQKKGIEVHSLKVYTNLDPDLQAKIETKTESDVTIAVVSHEKNALEAYYSTVGNIKRLPGSVIKPLLVYAPSIEEGMISPATPILDERTSFGNYQPQNYNGEYRGYISAREALAVSANVPAVKLLNDLTVEKGVGYLKKMGLIPEEEDKALSLALGGMKHGFTLKELVDGYSVFRAEGNYIQSHVIDRITDLKGHNLCQTEYKKKRVFSEGTASLLNDMLKTTVSEGTAKKLKKLPYPVYAKTGTVGTGNGNTDAYTIAYTGEHTVGIWLGYADYSTFSETGGGKACQIAGNVLQTLYPSKAPKDVAKSEQIKRIMLDRVAYRTEHKLLLADPNAPPEEKITEVFLKDQVPKKTSSYFSKPRIPKPTIEYKDGKVNIKLCDAEYYTFTIEKASKAGNTILYNKIQSSEVSDSDLKPGETYLYTVIPCYQDYKGEKITLPKVSIPPLSSQKTTSPSTTTVPTQPIPTEEPDILKKDWWNL